MPQTCVAIPVGGKVHLPFLAATLDILRQSDVMISIGLDEAEASISLNNYAEVRALCEDKAHKVLYFPRESYYRPGGIWQKILTCWEDSGCPFVRGVGYDDFVPAAGIAQQEALLATQPELMACYANLVTWFDKPHERREFTRTRLSSWGRVRAIGRNPFSFICWLARRELVLSADFRARTARGSFAWEWLFHAACLGAPCAHADTAPDASPVRREHAMTISSQYQALSQAEQERYHAEAFRVAGYSSAQTRADWDSLNMPAYYRQQRQQAVPLWGTLANLLPRRC